ncbi:MAG: hypothetical protein LN415_02340 [Candidatus Thermoplasmatota archaeon]|nr:hypothetical protein [Candidatus Thermoplasmatota archaeon]
MLRPEHCREVGIKDVDFPLNPESIVKAWKGERIYFRTKYLVLRSGDEHCVLGVKSAASSVMNDVDSIDIISLPNETVWVEDAEIDVLSPTQLVRVALQHPGKTVVVKGRFDHVSFVKDPEAMRIRVFDVVPPASKLVSLVRDAADSQAISVAVDVEEDLVDINVLAEDVKTEEILLPCEGELATEKTVLYLAKGPAVRDATLIGCEFSKKVARELYGRDLPFIQMCPWRLVNRTDVPTIVKCCELQSGFKIDGNVAIVPWGAKTEDVAQAVEHLLSGSETG